MGSLVAYLAVPDRSLQAVVWSHREIWMYAPAIAANLMFSDQFDQLTAEVDRATAERVSLEALNQTLPSEETLREMCQEGDRMG